MALFTNRVVAITGGASGIGFATANLLLSRKAAISIADINASGLSTAEETLKKAYPGAQIFSYNLDVTQESQVSAWIELIIATYGRLDGAANLAGVIGPSIGIRGVTDMDVAEWDFILDVNLKGTMLCLKHELRHVGEGGAVVNASSIGGVQGMPFNAAYSASKHGVIGLTRSAAKEVGKRGVRVNAVCPGYIDTPMNKQSAATQSAAAEAIVGGAAEWEEKRKKLTTGVALQRQGTADEVAELIVYLLSEGAAFISGSAVSVDGGWDC